MVEACRVFNFIEKQGFLGTEKAGEKAAAFQRGSLLQSARTFGKTKTFRAFSSCPVAPLCLLSPPKETDECVDFLQHFLSDVVHKAHSARS